jgi:hypothetical protein
MASIIYKVPLKSALPHFLCNFSQILYIFHTDTSFIPLYIFQSMENWLWPLTFEDSVVQATQHHQYRHFCILHCTWQRDHYALRKIFRYGINTLPNSLLKSGIWVTYALYTWPSGSRTKFPLLKDWVESAGFLVIMHKDLVHVEQRLCT